MKKRILIVVLLMFMTFGCIKTVTDGKASYRVDPNKAAAVEKTAEVSVTVMQALTPFFPWLGAVATGVGGGLAVWRQQKPKFIKEQTRADLFHGTAESLVILLEKFKGTNPTEWATLEKILIDKVGPETENVIRGLRGLPPKK